METVLYCTVLYCTVLHYNLLYCTLLYLEGKEASDSTSVFSESEFCGKLTGENPPGEPS